MRAPGLPSPPAVRRHDAQQGGLPDGARLAPLPARWCCASISAAWGAAQGEHAHWKARSKTRARRWTGCASAIPACPTRSRASRSARASSRAWAAKPTGAGCLMAAGFPTRFGPPDYLDGCAVPKVFIQSTHDQYGPRAELEATVQRLRRAQALHLDRSRRPLLRRRARMSSKRRCGDWGCRASTEERAWFDREQRRGLHTAARSRREVAAAGAETDQFRHLTQQQRQVFVVDGHTVLHRPGARRRTRSGDQRSGGLDSPHPGVSEDLTSACGDARLGRIRTNSYSDSSRRPTLRRRRAASTA